VDYIGIFIDFLSFPRLIFYRGENYADLPWIKFWGIMACGTFKIFYTRMDKDKYTLGNISGKILTAFGGVTGITRLGAAVQLFERDGHTSRKLYLYWRILFGYGTTLKETIDSYFAIGDKSIMGK